jgi:hypothetical protein
MMRKLAVLAALAAFAAAAAPASALNPQPLPPKSIYVNKYGNVLLNPQPLPPRLKYRYLRLYRR